MRLKTIKFELWWQGFEVGTPEAQEYMAEKLEKAFADFGVTPSGSHDPWDVADHVAQQLRGGKIRHALLRLLLRRVGRDTNGLVTGLHTLTVFALGGEPMWDDSDVGADDADELSPRQAVTKLMGLDRASTDETDDGTRLIPEPLDIPEFLGELRSYGMFEFSKHPETVRSASPVEMEQARRDAQPFCEDLPTIVRALEVGTRADFAGLGIISVLYQTSVSFFRLIVIIAMLLIRRAIGGDGIEQVNETFRSQVKKLEAFLILRDRFPQYSKYFKLVEYEEQWKILPVDLVAKMKTDINAYLDANPEIKDTLLNS